MYQFKGSHVGYIFDGNDSTPHIAAMLTVEFDSITLEVPLLADLTAPYDAWFTEGPPPEHLIFRNAEESFSLSGLSVRRHKRNWGFGHGVGILEADRIVRSGLNDARYTAINGLQSEIVGLPWWIAPDVFTYKHHTDAEGRITGADFHLTSTPAIQIPGVPGLTLTPTFDFDHDWANGRHEMFEFVVVQTEFESLTGWHIHHRLQRALQDLVSISFWHPCNLSVKRVLHADDPERTIDGTSHGTTWRRATVSGFGRRAKGQRVRTIAKNKDRPLFAFADIGIEGVAKWYREYDELGQAMWILSASLFREGGTVEVRLLQVGTALEALGYELAIRGGRLTKGKRDPSFTFAKALELVVKSTDCNLNKVLKGQSPADWAQLFNSSYKGVKHADNPLPDGSDAYHRAEEGALLARLWLALHLGVPKDQLAERQASIHT